MLWSAVTPRSIKSQDLDCGRRFIPEDLVLDLHRLKAPLASLEVLTTSPASFLIGETVSETSIDVPSFLPEWFQNI